MAIVRRRVTAGFLLILLLSHNRLFAQTPRIQLAAIQSGLNQPVYITTARDGSNRKFIVEQPGRIKVLQPASHAITTFLDISNTVLSGGERGLLGLAFHPQFKANGRFFVDYTRQPDGATVIAEYHVSATNPNLAEGTSAILLTIPQPYENHNGGMIDFGPDGYLYIGMGDGGSANDPGNRAQNIGELLGKILRIDVDRPSIAPPGNPFAGAIPGRDEIYAFGLRNPWRFSFDRATRQLYAGDVGQNVREEVDIITAGGNYGWRVLEGTRCTGNGPASCSNSAFVPPIAEYDHAANGRCSITGGYVYRGVQQTLPLGAYIFGDYCSGEIFLLQGGVQSVLLDTALNISSFGEDESGELYVVDLNGTVYQLIDPEVTMTSTRVFSLGNHAAWTTAIAGAAGTTTGYVRIQAAAGAALPGGMAIIGYRNHGILVSEAGVPAMPLVSSGRLNATITGATNTGIAIANPNGSDATIAYYFTDSNGNNFGGGAMSIPAGRQVAAFLSEAPFDAGGPFQGTFTFTSTLPVSAIGLRGLINGRDDFLMTTIPFASLAASPAGTQTIPQLADGGGWTTDILLVNPTDAIQAGSIQLLDPSGEPYPALALGIAAGYSIAPRSSIQLHSTGSDGDFSAIPVRVGSVRIAPDAGAAAPQATAIVSFRSGGVTINQTGITAIPDAPSFRLYVENMGDFNSAPGSIQTGIAIANTAADAAAVTLQLFGIDGSAVGASSSISIPGGGQTSMFLNQMPLLAVPAAFQGVLQVTSPSTIAVAGLRGRFNERGDFLIVATAPVPGDYTPDSPELLFPHFAIGGGYQTQFVLFSGKPGTSSGTTYFFDAGGNPMNLPLR